MFSAAEARVGAANAAEENKAKVAEKADKVIAEKIEPAVTVAVSEGRMSLAITMPNCEAAVADAVYEKLSLLGFDVAVSAGSDASGFEKTTSTFTLYWSKDRGENPGNITRPKTLTVK